MLPLMTELEARYAELCTYTWPHGVRDFIHQHVVDSWGAQTAGPDTKPITIGCCLAGLYLHLEKGFTGREVQLAHMKMARRKQPWPAMALPADRGRMTAADVMLAPEGAARDAAIDAWCASVWQAFADSHDTIAALVRAHGVTP